MYAILALMAALHAGSSAARFSLARAIDTPLPPLPAFIVQVKFKAPAAAASERSESSRSEWGWGPTSSKE